MKRTIVYSLILGLMVVAGACSGRYVIENENAGKFSGKEATKIVFAWIDLKEDEWEKNRVKDKEEWTRLIENMNKMFQEAVNNDFKGKEIVFLSKEESQKAPASGDLFVTYEFKKLDRNFNGFSGGADTMYMDVQIHDLKTKDVVYSSSVKLSSKGSYMSQISFGGRLRNISQVLSMYLSERIMK